MEAERVKRELFYKILAFVFVVVAVISALALYNSWRKMTEETLFLSQSTCETAISRTYNLERGGADFKEIGGKIEEMNQYKKDSLKYTSIETNVEECGGSIGFWYEYKEGNKKFIYCLSSSEVIELDTSSCRSIGVWQNMKDSLNLLGRLIPGGSS